MKSINPKFRHDECQRYKFEDTKVVIVNSKGDYTQISNLDKISEQLSQPTNILLKFLGKYHGSNIFDDKNGIAGKLSKEKIDKYIDIYINNFIICKNNECDKPETILYLTDISKKKKELTMKCCACSNINKIEENDNKKIENIRKMLIKEIERGIEWVPKKGNMVMIDNIEEKDEYNPFE